MRYLPLAVCLFFQGTNQSFPHQRPIVDKQARYAFYHPSAEAVASMLTDLPYKILNAICFNLVIYFMTNLRVQVPLPR